jgi:hypothetical protein
MVDISNDILIAAHVDYLVIGDFEAAAYRRGAACFEEARASAQTAIRSLLSRGLVWLGFPNDGTFAASITALGEAFDRFVTVWSSTHGHEEQYGLGWLALSEQGHVLATDVTVGREQRERDIMTTVADRLRSHMGRLPDELGPASLEDIVRRVALAEDQDARFGEIILANAFASLDEIYMAGDATTRAVIEDALFAYDDEQSFDRLAMRLSPALRAVLRRYRRVLALIAPHYQ